jgi:site-specific recombinase XerD
MPNTGEDRPQIFKSLHESGDNYLDARRCRVGAKAFFMKSLVPLQSLPSLYARDDHSTRRTWEFFTAHIRNPNTRKAYARAAAEFAAWCEAHGVSELRQVQPFHVAAYIEGLQLAAPSIKQRLAALKMLFDWLVVGQVMPTNPASSVRGPKHSVKKGKTPVLAADEARALLDAIDIGTPVGLRDRALIGLMVYTFARVGAVTKMRVEDVYVQSRRTWVRLHEKGGKRHEMPCHHNLDEYLHAYIDGAQLGEGKGYLFRTAAGRTGQLTVKPMTQPDVYRMIRRRAADAGVHTKIGCHTFRATGITEYLRNGGKLEVAQQMANHESARTTGLYDRRNDQVGLDEVERIVI